MSMKTVLQDCFCSIPNSFQWWNSFTARCPDEKDSVRIPFTSPTFLIFWGETILDWTAGSVDFTLPSVHIHFPHSLHLQLLMLKRSFGLRNSTNFQNDIPPSNWNCDSQINPFFRVIMKLPCQLRLITHYFTFSRPQATGGQSHGAEIGSLKIPPSTTTHDQ